MFIIFYQRIQFGCDDGLPPASLGVWLYDQKPNGLISINENLTLVNIYRRSNAEGFCRGKALVRVAYFCPNDK